MVGMALSTIVRAVQPVSDRCPRTGIGCRPHPWPAEDVPWTGSWSWSRSPSPTSTAPSASTPSRSASTPTTTTRSATSSASSSSPRPGPRARSPWVSASPTPNRARPPASSWSSPTSKPLTPTWPTGASRSARSRTSSGAGSYSSPTPTATAGPSSRSSVPAVVARRWSPGSFRPALAGGQGLQGLLGPAEGPGGVGVGGADLGVEVEVDEDLGHPLGGQGVEVAADLGEGAGQRRPVRLALGPDLDRAPADEPQPVRVAAGPPGRVPDHLDGLADPGQVGRAAADPAVGQPAGPAQGRLGRAAKQQRRVGPLDRLGGHAGGRQPIELALVGRHLLGPQGPQGGQELLGPGPPPLEWHPDRRVLGLRPADPQPDVEAPPGDDVEGGQLLGQQGR